MLEFQPELEETMKARYKDALTPIYDFHKVLAGEQRPEELQKHVFDFYDGVRLIITHESKGYRILTHIVFSLNTPMEFECIGQFAGFVLEHLNSIRQDWIVGEVQMMSDGNVAHLIVDEFAAKAHLN